MITIYPEFVSRLEFDLMLILSVRPDGLDLPLIMIPFIELEI